MNTYRHLRVNSIVLMATHIMRARTNQGSLSDALMMFIEDHDPQLLKEAEEAAREREKVAHATH